MVTKYQLPLKLICIETYKTSYKIKQKKSLTNLINWDRWSVILKDI